MKSPRLDQTTAGFAALFSLALNDRADILYTMSYRIHTVGTIHRDASGAVLELAPAYLDALRGLAGFSHVMVIYWFDRNDTPEQRRTLLVHPRNNPGIPLTGVFATRSPRRPNLLGIDMARLLSVEGNRIRIDATDALDGTPIVDVKPYIPVSDAFPEAKVPEWVHEPGEDHG
ncbi:MAG: tRNA (N6-threonylcarbamoyladenosine(37)-N6)-methyltransferase TrmO [Deltaproteobacteria bacterium]|nr:tRNA (N6-threonylcarbamoyladenosine(37)-N6)-methyltransferase TrmO [Deltaproteobacteria bacterium]